MKWVFVDQNIELWWSTHHSYFLFLGTLEVYISKPLFQLGWCLSYG